MFKRRRIILIGAGLLALAACGGEDRKGRQKLERGENFLRRVGNSGGNDIMAGAAVAEAGADKNPAALVSVYYASLPDSAGDKFPEVTADHDALKPWSLLLRPGKKEGSVIVEGYGNDLKSPLTVAEFDVKGPKARP